MSTIASHYTTQASPVRHYLDKLGAAARAILGGMIASQSYHELAKKDVIAPRAKSAPLNKHVKDMAALNFEADRYESAMPNLSAELRFMAARG
ncbi:MAG TPA: hypothetical protein DCW29_16125 [Janthinobacterium sp.]|nr:hypothetical protein [Janthinobacterium sp.]